MARFKRGRCRRRVRCSLCTTHRWLGNAKGRFPARDEMEMRRSPLDDLGATPGMPPGMPPGIAPGIAPGIDELSRRTPS